MRFLVSFLIASISFSLCFGQVPDGYYDSAAGLEGNELKTALYTIIKGHTEYPYTDSGTDTWDILKETDKDPDNPDNVILLYTGWSVNAAQEWNSGSGWSREHVWSKSHGDFGTSNGPGTDAHHLRPCDPSVNSAKSNRWFDSCTVEYYDNDVFTGSYTSYDDWLWQPRDEVKGDVARMIFYMAARYEGENGEPDLYLIDYLPADNNTKEPVYAKLSTLMAWHLADPPDDWEMNRNDIIYSYQNNRNPFIDNPDYAGLIWGETTNITAPEISGLSVYAKDEHIRIVNENILQGHVYVYNTGGMLISQSRLDGNITDIDSGNLNSGLYIVQVVADGFVEGFKVVVGR
jgi:endonuclease I